MIDVTIIGEGTAVRACTELLAAAGFGLRRTFDFDSKDRSPIILGDIPAAWNVARQCVDSGRHLLIANPAQFTPERLGLLYESRRRAQALYLWSTRRYHPGYRFLVSLLESDTSWRPRYLRHESLFTEQAAPGFATWALAETAALVLLLTGEAPLNVAANGAANPMRNTHELLCLALDTPSLRAFLQVGLGEAVERRETFIAGERRRILIDELATSPPIRVISDDPTATTAAPRLLSTTPPSAREMARQQCLAFLDSTLHPDHTSMEAHLWTRAFAVLVAARQSMLDNGAATPVQERDSEAARLRVIDSIA